MILKTRNKQCHYFLRKSINPFNQKSKLIVKHWYTRQQKLLTSNSQKQHNPTWYTGESLFRIFKFCVSNRFPSHSQTNTMSSLQSIIFLVLPSVLVKPSQTVLNIFSFEKSKRSEIDILHNEYFTLCLTYDKSIWIHRRLVASVYDSLNLLRPFIAINFSLGGKWFAYL